MARWIRAATTKESMPPDSAQEHRVLAHLPADALDGRVRERGHGPVAGGAGREEVLQYGLALGRGCHLGMELHREGSKDALDGLALHLAVDALDYDVAVAHPGGHETPDRPHAVVDAEQRDSCSSRMFMAPTEAHAGLDGAHED